MPATTALGVDVRRVGMRLAVAPLMDSRLERIFEEPDEVTSWVGETFGHRAAVSIGDNGRLLLMALELAPMDLVTLLHNVVLRASMFRPL